MEKRKNNHLDEPPQPVRCADDADYTFVSHDTMKSNGHWGEVHRVGDHAYQDPHKNTKKQKTQHLGSSNTSAIVLDTEETPPREPVPYGSDGGYPRGHQPHSMSKQDDLVPSPGDDDIEPHTIPLAPAPCGSQSQHLRDVHRGQSEQHVVSGQVAASTGVDDNDLSRMDAGFTSYGFVLLEDNVSQEAAMQVLFAELEASGTPFVHSRPSDSSCEERGRPPIRADHSDETSGEVGGSSFSSELVMLVADVCDNSARALLELAEIDEFDYLFD